MPNANEMSNLNEQLRAEFEAWATSQNWTLNRDSFGDYVFDTVRDGWTAWQAARRQHGSAATEKYPVCALDGGRCGMGGYCKGCHLGSASQAVDKHSFTPMEQRGTLVYLGRAGGFDVRDCPEAEALAAFIVAACNAFTAPPVATQAAQAVGKVSVRMVGGGRGRPDDPPRYAVRDVDLFVKDLPDGTLLFTTPPVGCANNTQPIADAEGVKELVIAAELMACASHVIAGTPELIRLRAALSRLNGEKK